MVSVAEKGEVTMNDRPYPIEFCGNCGVGQRTKEDNPCFCDYWSPGVDTDRRCNSWTPAHFLHYERVVYICSPCRGQKLEPIDETLAENLRKAKAFCAAAIASHAIPICPHYYLCELLDERHPSDRNVGREIGIELLKRCDEIWVFGQPSDGMLAEIEEAKSLRLPIVEIPQSAINRILEKENENNG